MSRMNRTNKKPTNKKMYSDLLRLEADALRSIKNNPQNPQRKRVNGKKANGNGSSLGQLDSRPAAFSRRLNQGPVRERVGPGGSRILTFREFVQDIAGSVLFAATAFPINPGVPTLFAWLANQAIFYQEYQFKKLKFLFETEKSTATSGKVMYAFQQDASDPLPASKQEMLENQYKSGGAPWEPFQLIVNQLRPEALGKKRFVRSGTLSANLDIKTYDIGQLIVGVQGMADTSAVGELYCEYEIELSTPIQSAQALAASLSKAITSGGTVSSAASFGDAPTSTGGLDVTAVTNTLTFNRVGRYVIDQFLVGTGLHTSMVPVVSASTGSATLSSGNISNAAANAGTASIVSVIAVITARGQTIVIDNATMATTVTSSFTRVMQFSAS